MSPAPPSLRKSLRLTALINFPVRPPFPCYPGSRQTREGLASSHHMSRLYFVAILHGCRRSKISQRQGTREFRISLTETRQLPGQTSVNNADNRSILIRAPPGPREPSVTEGQRPAVAVSSPYGRTGVGSEPRVPRVLRFSEHGRERGSEDRGQLSRWKRLVDEAQRLDQRNGVRDVAHQSQRPPGVVRGELQEP